MSTRRKWIKLYVDETLRGTTFKELNLEERAIWFGLLLLAGDSPFQETGAIAITEDTGYTSEQLSSLLNADVEVIKRALKRLVEVEKIKIDDNGVITIVNWNKYQSTYTKDYIRVKRWREQKKKQDDTLHDTHNDTGNDTGNDTYNDTVNVTGEKGLVYSKLSVEKKRELINAEIERVVSKIRKEYPISVRLVPKTKIRLGNILHSLAESEGSVEKAGELVLKAWQVYYKTGRRGTGTWMKWINEKSFSFSYFISVIQYFIDAVATGQDILTDKKRSSSVTKVSKSFEDFGDEEMPF